MNGTFNISRDERLVDTRSTESRFHNFLEGRNHDLSTLREKYIVTAMKMTTIYNPIVAHLLIQY